MTSVSITGIREMRLRYRAKNTRANPWRGLRPPKPLPNKPSKLIRLALADLEKIERSKRYRVDMGQFHNPIDTKPRRAVEADRCAVCFAGSVMAKTAGAPRGRWLFPVDYDPDTHMKLVALDRFRLGDIIIGLVSMGLAPIEEEERAICHYDVDPKQFKRDMRKLADDLEELKL